MYTYMIKKKYSPLCQTYRLAYVKEWICKNNAPTHRRHVVNPRPQTAQRQPVIMPEISLQNSPVGDTRDFPSNGLNLVFSKKVRWQKHHWECNCRHISITYTYSVLIISLSAITANIRYRIARVRKWQTTINHPFPCQLDFIVSSPWWWYNT